MNACKGLRKKEREPVHGANERDGWKLGMQIGLLLAQYGYLHGFV